MHLCFSERDGIFTLSKEYLAIKDNYMFAQCLWIKRPHDDWLASYLKDLWY